MSKKIKDFILLGLGRGIIALTSILYIRIFTAMLTPAEVGRMNIILSATGWFALVLVNPVGMYMNRRLLEWEKEGTMRLRLNGWMGYLLGISMFSIILIPLYRSGLGIHISSLWLAVLVAAGIIITSGNASYAGFLNLLGHRLYFVAGSVLALWAGLLLSILLVRLFPASAESWLAGQLGGQGIAFLLILALLYKALPEKDAAAAAKKERADFGAVWNFSWPLSISVFLYWIQTQGYRFIFQHESGSEALGIFVVGFAIGSSLMLVFESLFNQFYQPIYYAEISHASDEAKTVAWDRYAEIFLPMVLATVVFVAANGGAIAHIMASEKFRQGGRILLWGALAEGLRMMVSMLALISHSKLKMSPIILPGVVGVATMLCLLFPLLPWDPFVGAGVAIVAGWLVSGVLMYFSMRRLLPVRFPWQRLGWTLILVIPILVVRVAAGPVSVDTALSKTIIPLFISTVLLIFVYSMLLHGWLPAHFREELLLKVRAKRKVVQETLLEMFPFR